jgi:hypothetical protein
LLYTIEIRKAKWIGHILWRIQVKEKGVTRYMQLLDDPKEMKGYKKLNQEAQDRTLWITCFGGGCGPVIRHTTE